MPVKRIARHFWYRFGPVAAVLIAILVIWYAAAVMLNAPGQRDAYARSGVSPWRAVDLVRDSLAQPRPVLPAPHQVAVEVFNTTLKRAVTSKRSLVYHAWITLSSTLLGFFMGTCLGIVLAVVIVHNRAMDKSLMPWIITSQTIPILAIAPMVIVVLNAVGIQGLLPKAFISMYLSFFPVAVGMVKGLRAPEPVDLDLLYTYNASRRDIFWKLRWPASMGMLFASMRIAVAVALVGAIVGELPTGAVAGLGARLLAGSYYGQTIQIWAALIVAACLAAALVGLVGVAHRIMLRRMGVRET